MAANGRESTQIRHPMRVDLRPFAAFCISIAAVVIVACAQRTPAHQVDAIVRAFDRDEIETIETLQIPKDILINFRVSPERLEEWRYDKQLVTRDFNGFRNREQLVDALRSISPQPRGDGTDVRSGVIFYYGYSSMRVGALYFNADGSLGYVNKSPVSFKGDFWRLLDQTLSPVVR